MCSNGFLFKPRKKWSSGILHVFKKKNAYIDKIQINLDMWGEGTSTFNPREDEMSCVQPQKINIYPSQRSEILNVKNSRCKSTIANYERGHIWDFFFLTSTLLTLQVGTCHGEKWNKARLIDRIKKEIN